jgi:hypothetical protein
MTKPERPSRRIIATTVRYFFWKRKMFYIFYIYLTYCLEYCQAGFICSGRV